MYVPAEVERILYTQEQIQDRVRQLGKTLTAEYTGKNPLFLGVLKGSCVFFSDLIRAVECPLEIEFIKASSYCGTSSTGNVDHDKSAIPELAGRDVVLVEDIVDTARTLSVLKENCLEKEPNSLKVVCMLDKPNKRMNNDFKADLVGFEIKNDPFVVGYGLDCDQKFRNLPYIGIFKTK